MFNDALEIELHIYYDAMSICPRNMQWLFHTANVCIYCDGFTSVTQRVIKVLHLLEYIGPAQMGIPHQYQKLHDSGRRGHWQAKQCR